MKTYPLAYQNQQRKLKQQYEKLLLQQCRQQNVKKEKHHKVHKEETDVALVVGRAAWWIPVLPTNNNMRNLTFAEALRDFLQNVSFHCYGKLVETGHRYQERLFWLVFHIAALSTLIVFLWHYPNTGGHLLRTTLHDRSYPKHKIQIPAVSICSINRISNASATRYAEELNRKDPLKRGVKYFYDLIKLLKYNYKVPNGISNYFRALEFQSFLDLYDRNDDESFYDTRSRMAMLAPNCSDILRECSLGGKKINCAEGFEETFTSWGLCCTFNNKYSKARKPYSGANFNLDLLLSAPWKDNFFQIFDSDGFIVELQSPFTHPDLISGRAEGDFALTGTDSHFGIKTQVHKTVKETARIYNAKARSCLFNDELPQIYGNEYSFDNCITRCRLHSVFVLCGCYPFQTSLKNKSTANDTVICSLQHTQCLMRYHFKWLNVITQKRDIPGLEREMEDSLHCPDCLPSCSETRYKVQKLNLDLTEYSSETLAYYQENYSYSELAWVHIYFISPNVIYYRQVIVDSWIEVLSRVGNICSIIAGFSLIGICEVMFFVITQFITEYKRDVLCHGQTKVTPKQTLDILP